MAILPRPFSTRRARDVLGTSTVEAPAHLSERWPIASALAHLPVGLFELM
jgi:hypothetical protein